MQHERNSRFSATARHVAARRLCPARLQRPESSVRKHPSRPVHFPSLGHHHHIRASSARIPPHREWHSHRVVLSLRSQRDNSQHPYPEQFQLQVTLTTALVTGPGTASVTINTPSGNSGNLGCTSGGSPRTKNQIQIYENRTGKEKTPAGAPGVVSWKVITRRGV
jgi:hypothetical protein